MIEVFESGVMTDHSDLSMIFRTGEDQRAALRGEKTVSEATARAYQIDWSRFTLWCAGAGVAELPAEVDTICRFLESLRQSGSSIAALNRHIATIGYMHRQSGLASPLVLPESQRIRDIMAQMAESDQAPVRRPTMRIWSETLRAIGDSGPADIRDRALLALHAAGAFRALELERLIVTQLRIERASMQIHLGRFRSNTARGTSVITLVDDPRLMPVTHMRRWLTQTGADSGVVFRHCEPGRVTEEPMSAEDVCGVILARARDAGHRLVLPPIRR